MDHLSINCALWALAMERACSQKIDQKKKSAHVIFIKAMILKEVF
jgi:hypothetical protein